MRTPNLASILIVGFLNGGIFSFIGAIIKYFNAGDIINSYDEKKHDKDKVSKVFGGNFIFIVSDPDYGVGTDKYAVKYLNWFS